MLTSFSQFTPVKVKKTLRKYQPQLPEKLNKLRLKQKGIFVQNRTCTSINNV